MTDKPLLSLCIPTNGVEHWVFPVLESIYDQQVDTSLFEVVVTDNGDNRNFYDRMLQYCTDKPNLNYQKTDAKLFMSEIACYRQAKGVFIKFLNHRTKLLPGALDELIRFAAQNQQDKPVVYFSNGALRAAEPVRRLSSFDQFVQVLSHYSSWSTGMGFWKERFDALPEDLQANELFPHTAILFSDRTNSCYIVDDRVLLEELPTGKTPKGRYDLFYAFAVEYPSILCDLLRTADISTETFLRVKRANLVFVSRLYMDYVLRRLPCSYDLSSYNSSIHVYYSKAAVKIQVVKFVFQKVGKIFKTLFAANKNPEDIL